MSTWCDGRLRKNDILLILLGGNVFSCNENVVDCLD